MSSMPAAAMGAVTHHGMDAFLTAGRLVRAGEKRRV